MKKIGSCLEGAADTNCGTCYYYSGRICRHVLNILEGRAGRKKKNDICNRWLSAKYIKAISKAFEETAYILASWAESCLMKIDNILTGLPPESRKYLNKLAGNKPEKKKGKKHEKI